MDTFCTNTAFAHTTQGCQLNYCRAQRSGARLGNRDVAPVTALQSRPRERQMYVTVLVPGGPSASLSHVILLGVSKYVSNRAKYFLRA